MNRLENILDGQEVLLLANDYLAASWIVDGYTVNLYTINTWHPLDSVSLDYDGIPTLAMAMAKARELLEEKETI